MLSFRPNVKNRHRHELFSRIAVGLNDRLINGKITRGGDVVHPHGYRCRFKQRRVTVFAFDQGLFGQFALGDVALHRHPMGKASFGIEHRHDLELKPELPATLGVIDQFGPHWPLRSERCADALHLGGLSFGASQKAQRLTNYLFAAVAGMALKGVVDKNDAWP